MGNSGRQLRGIQHDMSTREVFMRGRRRLLLEVYLRRLMQAGLISACRGEFISTAAPRHDLVQSMFYTIIDIIQVLREDLETRTEDRLKGKQLKTLKTLMHANTTGMRIYGSETQIRCARYRRWRLMTPRYIFKQRNHPVIPLPKTPSNFG